MKSWLASAFLCWNKIMCSQRLKLPDMPCIRKVCRDKRRSTRQQPGTKSAFRPADKPLIYRWSNADVFPPSVYFFCFFVLLKRHSKQVCSMSWGQRKTFVSWANRSVGVPSCPARPCSAAPLYAAPTRNRLWYVRVLDSTG